MTNLPTVAAAATAAAVTAATTATGFVLRLVDLQRTTTHLLAVEGLLGRHRRVVVHLDEAEASGTAGLAVHDQRDRVNLAVGTERFADVIFGRRERQVANVQF